MGINPDQNWIDDDDDELHSQSFSLLRAGLMASLLSPRPVLHSAVKSPLNEVIIRTVVLVLLPVVAVM